MDHSLRFLFWRKTAAQLCWPIILQLLSLERAPGPEVLSRWQQVVPGALDGKRRLGEEVGLSRKSTDLDSLYFIVQTGALWRMKGRCLN